MCWDMRNNDGLHFVHKLILQTKKEPANVHERNCLATLTITDFATQSTLTISQGREAFVGSLFLCERALQATKPPNPTCNNLYD